MSAPGTRDSHRVAESRGCRAPPGTRRIARAISSPGGSQPGRRAVGRSSRSFSWIAREAAVAECPNPPANGGDMDYLNGQVLQRLTACIGAGPTSSRAAVARSVRRGYAESRRCSLTAQPLRKARELLRAVHRRESAVRVSGRTRVRLLWRQGTPQLCVEVRESDDWTLASQVQPEKAGAWSRTTPGAGVPSRHRTNPGHPANVFGESVRGVRQPMRFLRGHPRPRGVRFNSCANPTVVGAHDRSSLSG